MRTFLLLILSGAFLLACGETPAPAAANTPVKANAIITDGQAIYRQYCVACHGADGKLGLNGAKDLTQSALTLEERTTQIAKGKNLMTPFEELLNPEEIKAVAEYTLTLKK